MIVEFLVIVPVVVTAETVPVVFVHGEVTIPVDVDQEVISSSNELILGIVSQLTLKICMPVHESWSFACSFSFVPFT